MVVPYRGIPIMGYDFLRMEMVLKELLAEQKITNELSREGNMLLQKLLDVFDAEEESEAIELLESIDDTLKEILKYVKKIEDHLD